MCCRSALLAAMFVMAPLGAKSADLVVWWEQGFYPEEDQAIRETIAAFEQKTGKHVELVLPDQDDLLDKVQAAIEVGQPLVLHDPLCPLTPVGFLRQAVLRCRAEDAVVVES